MAGSELRTFILMVALAVNACDRAQERGGQGSITVKLPPARPAAAAPGFSFRPSASELEKNETAREAAR
jgi:hypothetical protein